MIRRKRKVFYTLLTAALILFFFSLYYLFTPIDLTAYKRHILPRVERALRTEISIERFTIIILPYPRLSLRDVTASKRGEIIFKAEYVSASLFLMPLIFDRRFEVKNLIIGRPEFIVKRDAHGGFNVRIVRGVPIPVSIKKVRIRDGTAQIIDESLDTGRTYYISDIDTTLTPKGTSDFSYICRLQLLPSTIVRLSGETENEMEYLEGKADIEGLDIGQGWPYLKEIFKGEEWGGKANLSLDYRTRTASLDHFSIKGHVIYSSLTASAPPLFSKAVYSPAGVLSLDVVYESGRTAVSVTDAELQLPEFSVSATFKFEGGKARDGKIALNLNTTPIPLDSVKEQFFIPMLPSGISDALNPLSFQGGQIEVSRLAVDGYIKDLMSPSYYKTSGSLTVKTDIKGAAFNYEGFRRKFSSIDGRIMWQDGSLSLNDVSGRYGKGIVDELEASIDWLLEDPLIRLKGRFYADAAEAFDEFNLWSGKNGLSTDMEKVKVDGIFSLQFDMKGRWGKEKDIILSATLDTTSAELVYSSWLKKERGLTATADAQMRVTGDILLIDAARIDIGRSVVNMNGRYSLGSEISYLFNVTAHDIRLDDLDSIIPYIRTEYAPRGYFSSELRINMAPGEVKPKVNGSIQVKDGELETEYLSGKVSRLNIAAIFSGRSAKVKIEEMRVGDSDLSGSLNIPDIATASNIDFDLSSTYLDYDDFYQKKEGKGVAVAISSGKGSLRTKEVKFGNFHISSLEADMLFRSDAILLDTVFAINDGRVVVKFTHSMNEKDDFLWRLTLDALRVDMEPMLRDAGAQEKIISGQGDMKAEFIARRGEGKITSRINGKGEISSKKGKLWKFIIMSKLFSIVNILSIDELFKKGLPYKTISGNFTIKDGVISTDNLLLDSDSMRMSMIGTVGMSDMTIDAKLGFHPFVTIDKIITRVPLAGWIIGGKEKSTVSMYYEIKGPLNNPTVDAIPVKALGKGILDVFKRVLRLPLGAVEPLVE